MIGRPKLGVGETVRLQLKISEEEFAQIDDWRFANRVDSRSEAVRRLMQIGLRADARALDILEASRASLEAAKRIAHGIQDQLENPGEGEADNVTVSAQEFGKALRSAFEAQEAAGGLVADVQAFHPTSDAVDELEKAIAARDAYKQLVYARGDREHEE